VHPRKASAAVSPFGAPIQNAALPGNAMRVRRRVRFHVHAIRIIVNIEKQKLARVNKIFLLYRMERDRKATSIFEIQNVIFNALNVAHTDSFARFYSF
jgi:hypothetical protein